MYQLILIMSAEFWNAEDSGQEPIIKWSIADRATAYHVGVSILQFMPD